MRRLALIASAACVLLSACATARPIPYNWGDYSSSLYRLKKDSSDENLQAHKQVLVKIIQGSDGQTLRVPPGVYAEYGYILVKEGKTEEGMKYLDLEAQTFPESKVFIERVKAQAVQPTNEKERKQ
jgi:hypothetical protein